MEHVEVVRRIPATPEAIWQVLANHEGWVEWTDVTWVKLVRPGAPQPNGLGAVRAAGSFGLSAHEEIVAFEPAKRFGYRVVRGGFPTKNYSAEIELEPDGTGTRAVWRGRLESRIPGLGWLVRKQVRLFFTRSLRGLERHLSSVAGA